MIQFEVNEGSGPLLVTAIHNGHNIRPELLPYFSLTEPERLREEDPYTAYLTGICSQTIVVDTSRFETDLNRPPDKAIYIKSEDAWGLDLYQNGLPTDLIQRSRANYTYFYDKLTEYIDAILAKQDYLIIYDLHSYNHRREGIDRYALPDGNPEINIGTKNTAPIWRPVIEQLITSMRSFNFQGRYLDIRENVKFQGGYFSKWLNGKYGSQVCPVAIEFKKFFMNEWTGEPDLSQLDALRQLLITTIRPVIESAGQIKNS